MSSWDKLSGDGYSAWYRGLNDGAVKLSWSGLNAGEGKKIEQALDIALSVVQPWFPDKVETNLNPVLLVEANSFERYCLWKEWHERTATWVSGGGPAYTINGTTLFLNFQQIGDKEVCFWNPTSQLLNWKDCEDWLAVNFPGVPTCDAQDFSTGLREAGIEYDNKPAKLVY